VIWRREGTRLEWDDKERSFVEVLISFLHWKDFGLTFPDIRSLVFGGSKEARQVLPANGRIFAEILLGQGSK
jgi:hypothetical protein